MGFLDFLGGAGDWASSLFGGTPTPTPSSAVDVLNMGGTAAPPTPTGGGSFWGSLGDIAKGIAPIAGLATTGAGIGAGIYSMEQAAQQRNILEKQQKQQQQLAAPAAAAGQQLTAAGSQAMLGGDLPPQLQSQVEQWKSQARLRIRDYLAKAGITDSTMAAQFESWIDMQADTLKSQLAQNLLQSGYSGITSAMGPSGQVSATAAGLMGGTSELLAAANKSIAQLLGATGSA